MGYNIIQRQITSNPVNDSVYMAAISREGKKWHIPTFAEFMSEPSTLARSKTYLLRQTYAFGERT